MKRNILILGATSAIARATAMAFAKNGDSVYLAGRDRVELEKISADIYIRYNIPALYGEFNIEDIQNHAGFFENILTIFPQLDGVVCAIGTMEGSILTLLNINLNSVVNILEICAHYFEQRKSGFMIGISSCAGDRGRQSNYIYGTAKGGLNIYLEGLRNRLYKSHVRVITIKPGFVDTQMTFGLPGLFLVANPKNIGQAIANTLHKKNDIFYLPWFWRYIMLIIRHIPEFIFKRMSL